MKKIIALIVAATAAVCAWATDTSYSPAAEYNLRPKADGTGWTTKPTAAAGKPKFECTASACFYAVQQYKVADIQYATSVTLTLTDGSGSDALAIWAFNGTFDPDMTASDFNTAFENTTGVKPGSTGTHTTTYLLKDIANSKSRSKFIISGTALAKLQSMAAADGSFTLLVTNKTADLEAKGTTKRTYWSSSSENAEADRPVLTVTAAAPSVTNLTTGKGYTDLADAVSTATAGDVLQVNENISVSSRIATTVGVTIQGKTGAEVITCTTNAGEMLFLPGKDAPLTLKNIVLDGNGTTRTNCAIEASNTLLTMDSVTVQNFVRYTSGANQGLICIKTSGSVVLNGCTFKDNSVNEGYGDVFAGRTNALTLKGCNAVGNGIYVEKALYINDGGTTHTTPVKVIAASNRGDSTVNGLGSAKAFIKGTTDIYKYTLSGNSAWSLAGNEASNWIYVTKSVSITLPSDRTMEAGKGYRIGTVRIE